MFMQMKHCDRLQLWGYLTPHIYFNLLTFSIPYSVLPSELHSTTCIATTKHSALCCYLTGLGDPL